jgi:hypothetical protein
LTAYSFKERFIRPIEIGLGSVQLSWDPAPKRQTIRANGKRRHARPGEELQLYYAMRTKQCRLIGRARCTEVLPIKIRPRTMMVWLNRQMLVHQAVTALAIADGFSDAAEMKEFWLKEHPDVETFEGVLIRWEPLTN